MLDVPVHFVSVALSRRDSACAVFAKLAESTDPFSNTFSNLLTSHHTLQQATGGGMLNKLVKGFGISSKKSSPSEIPTPPGDAPRAAVTTTPATAADLHAELLAFIEMLESEPGFGDIHSLIPTSLVHSFNEPSRSSSDSVASRPEDNYFGPKVLPPGDISESTVMDIIAAFVRRGLPPRAMAAELLERQERLLEKLPNVVHLKVPPTARTRMASNCL